MGLRYMVNLMACPYGDSKCGACGQRGIVQHNVSSFTDLRQNQLIALASELTMHDRDAIGVEMTYLSMVPPIEPYFALLEATCYITRFKDSEKVISFDIPFGQFGIRDRGYRVQVRSASAEDPLMSWSRAAYAFYAAARTMNADRQFTLFDADVEDQGTAIGFLRFYKANTNTIANGLVANTDPGADTLVATTKRDQDPEDVERRNLEAANLTSPDMISLDPEGTSDATALGSTIGNLSAPSGGYPVFNSEYISSGARLNTLDVFLTLIQVTAWNFMQGADLVLQPLSFIGDWNCKTNYRSGGIDPVGDSRFNISLAVQSHREMVYFFMFNVVKFAEAQLNVVDSKGRKYKYGSFAIRTL